MHVWVVCAWVHGSPRWACAHGCVRWWVRTRARARFFTVVRWRCKVWIVIINIYGVAQFAGSTQYTPLGTCDRSQQSPFWIFSKIHAVRATSKISFRGSRRPFHTVRLHFWIRENFRRWPHSPRTSLRILPTWIFKFSLRHQQAADFNVCQTALCLHYASSKIRHKSLIYKA